MKTSIRKGFGFGITSGIITTLGLIVGLNSGTKSRLVVFGGIIIIAIADALSDSLGIHISEEAENKHSNKEIWEATFATLFSKFGFAMTFAIPIFFLELSTAVIVSIIWGLSLIGIFSYYIARKEHMNPYRAVLEHLIIAIAVIVITHFVGDWVAAFA